MQAYPDLQQSPLATVSSGHSTSTVHLVIQHPLCSGPGAHTQLYLCMSVLTTDAEKIEPGQVWQDSETEALCCTMGLWPCCSQNQFRSLSGFATSAKCRTQPDKPTPGRTSGVVSGPRCWSCEGWELRCKDT